MSTSEDQEDMPLPIKDLMDQASGNNCQGIVGCAIEGLDSRMAEVNTRTENSENACLEAEFISKSAGFLLKSSNPATSSS